MNLLVPCCSKLLLSLSCYGGLKFSLLHRKKVSHSCLCIPGNSRSATLANKATHGSIWSRHVQSLSWIWSENFQGYCWFGSFSYQYTHSYEYILIREQPTERSCNVSIIVCGSVNHKAVVAYVSWLVFRNPPMWGHYFKSEIKHFLKAISWFLWREKEHSYD